MVENNFVYATGDDGDADDDPELAAAIAASLGGPPPASSGDAFEADLARAIALSTQESQSSVGAAAPSTADASSGKSEKEIAREKRLAALAARGL